MRIKEMLESLDSVYIAVIAFALLVVFGGLFTLCGHAFAQHQEIMPTNAPIIQAKTIHILTADERSEIIIHDVWEQPTLDSIKIGKGAFLGLIRAAPSGVAQVEPVGWQAYINQKVRGSWRGSYEAVSYGAL